VPSVPQIRKEFSFEAETVSSRFFAPEEEDQRF